MKRQVTLLGLVLALGSLPLLLSSAAHAQTAYSTRGGTPHPIFCRLDLATGSIVDIGSTLANGASFRGLTFGPEGDLFAYAADDLALPLGLYRIDIATGVAGFIGGGGVVAGDRISSLATEPISGRLIGAGRRVQGALRLYAIDPATGAATVDAALPAPPDPIDSSGLWIDPAGRRFVVGYGSVFTGNAEFAQAFEVIDGELVPLPQGLGYVPNAGGQAVGQDPLTERAWIVGTVGWSQHTLFELDTATGAAVQVIPGVAFALSDLAFAGLEPAPQGSAYCDAVANSTGSAGQIEGFGSVSVSTNLFEVRASALPANQFGLLLFAPERDFVPMAGGSQGNLCLAPSSGIGRFPVDSTGLAGQLSRRIPLDALPLHGAVQPGETWYFQAWHRDQNPSATSNFTRGLRVGFE